MKTLLTIGVILGVILIGLGIYFSIGAFFITHIDTGADYIINFTSHFYVFSFVLIIAGLILSLGGVLLRKKF